MQEEQSDARGPCTRGSRLKLLDLEIARIGCSITGMLKQDRLLCRFVLFESYTSLVSKGSPEPENYLKDSSRLKRLRNAAIFGGILQVAKSESSRPGFTGVRD